MKSTLNIAIACLTLAGTLSCSETGSLPDSSGPTAGNAGTTIFQYDITVTGHAQDAYTQSDKAPYFNGTLTQTIDWTTTFTNVAFKKTTFTSAAYKYKKGAGGDAFAVTSINGDLIQGGATEAKYTFDETIPATGGPCKGMIRLSTLGTNLHLYGMLEFNGHTQFHFDSQLDPSAAEQLATTRQQQTNAACGNRV